MKKLIALLTVLALVLATGCAGGTNNQTDETTEPGKTSETTDAPEDPSDVTHAEDVNADDKPQTGFLLFEAKYPERTKRPDDNGFGDDYDALNAAYEKWTGSRKAYEEYDASRQEGMNGFVTELTRALLGNADGDNKVCSPLNVYMALAMLAELTDGATQQELLDALGAKDAAALREQAKALWDANYLDDGSVTSVLADSVWLNGSVHYKDAALQTLARDYFASVFSGEPGTDEYDDALREWINEQTGGLLKDSAGGLQMDPLMMVTLVSAVYFRARWGEEFDARNNTTETFHGAKQDASCEMMHLTDGMDYYDGKGFSAVTKSLLDANGFRFILPDEGVSADEVLQSKEFADYLTKNGGDGWEGHSLVALSVPKFDVTADSDVIPALKDMGVEKVFDHSAADFSPLTEDRDDIAVDKVQHSARVKIDEEGCEAAAFTAVMAYATGALISEPIDFTLDRPFIFVINGAGGTPLFVGIVNGI